MSSRLSLSIARHQSLHGERPAEHEEHGRRRSGSVVVLTGGIPEVAAVVVFFVLDVVAEAGFVVVAVRKQLHLHAVASRRGTTFAHTHPVSPEPAGFLPTCLNAVVEALVSERHLESFARQFRVVPLILVVDEGIDELRDAAVVAFCIVSVSVVVVVVGLPPVKRDWLIAGDDTHSCRLASLLHKARRIVLGAEHPFVNHALNRRKAAGRRDCSERRRALCVGAFFESRPVICYVRAHIVDARSSCG
mmetsp:Transcript_29546/g.96225  ORF Transcript_29546/g.96225 Transcript_29546/m.96225 type:complete len:247 (+) Transcript_29546:49-789(+)